MCLILKEEKLMANYSGYLLCSSNGTNSDYFSVPVTARPGGDLAYTESPDTNVLLAGGFSTIHPTSQFPLSASLQLNGDLTETDAPQMAALAKAEYIRHNSQSHKKYSLESDPRVAVLATNSSALQAFTDTYGGVLQIDAILTKGYHPDFSTAEEIQIQKTANHFKLGLTIKQPIDTDRCTYCGACGFACPEHCISEHLFLDYSRCSFCKDCVTACSHNAIDLYAVERRELITPAILVLGDVQVELPENTKKIFSEDTLPELFKSIYASEVEEIIRWDSTYCQYSARLSTGCSACLTSCDYGAVSQTSKGVQINQLACVECGACLGSCPTGALQYNRFDDASFIEYFKTFPLVPGTTVVLGSEQELHKHWWYSSDKKRDNLFFMEYPSITAIHAMHILQLYAMGAKRVFIIDDNSSNTGSQIELCNALIQTLFQQDQCVQLINTSEISQTLTDDDSAATLSQFYTDFTYGNRRNKLIDIIQFLRQQSDAKATHITTDYFGEIICNEAKCTQCLACINECRMEALVADGDSFSLRHTPALCVQCGICVTVCPENVLTEQNGIALQDTFFTEKTLSQAEPAKCKGCGKVFGTQKSLEKVMAILSAKNMWDSNDDLLSYCDDCRVINLYRSSESLR